MFEHVITQIRLFETLWTVALWASLSMGFSQQEYWSGLPFALPRDLPSPGIQPILSIAGGLYISEPPEKPNKRCLLLSRQKTMKRERNE